MIKKGLGILLVLLLALSSVTVFAEAEYDYEPGLLFGKPLTFDDGSGELWNLTDGFNSTGDYLDRFAYYEFPEPIDITGYYILAGFSGTKYVRYYYENGTMFEVRGAHGKAETNQKNVIAVSVGAGAAINYYSIEFYGEPSTEIAIPGQLEATSGNEKVTLNWFDQKAFGYNVYRNGEKLNGNPIRENQFVDTTGVPDVIYAYQVTAVNSNGFESPKSQIVHASSYLELVKPSLRFSEVTDRSVRLEWDRVGARYDVFQDGELIVSNRTFPFVDVANLASNTQYDFFVRAYDRHGRYVDSDSVTVQTMKVLLKPPVLKFSDVKHDSFSVEWQLVQGAEGYDVYLNDEKQSVSGTKATFENLKPDTVYSVRVEAFTDEDRVSVTRSVTTSRSPVPRIEHASVAPSAGGSPTERTLKYQPNDLVSAVKVYINGKLVGEFPADQREIEIDFADLEDAIMADITIEPVDENGEPYNLKTPVQTTENSLIDQIIGNLLDAFQISKKAFLYIAIWSVVFLVLIVTLFFWLRKKFKRMLGGAKLTKRQHRRQTKKFTDGYVGSIEDRYYGRRDRYGNKPTQAVPAYMMNQVFKKSNGKRNTRSPTQRSGKQYRSTQQKDKAYFQSFDQRKSNFESRKVVNFNDSSNVIAFQDRVREIQNKRRR